MKGISVLMALAIGSTAFASVPSIESLEVTRNGDDLTIAWTAPAEAVDGYRVYRSADVACAAELMVYEGIDTRYTDVGALANPELGLYRIAAFTRAEEGPRTNPVYKFPVALPTPVPGALNGVLVSVPYLNPIVSGATMCGDLNGDISLVAPVARVTRWNEASCSNHEKPCGSGFYCFWTEDGWAYVMYAAAGAAPTDVMIWGDGSPEWRLEFLKVREIIPQPGYPDAIVNLYHVTLPYDHDYRNLAEIAAEIPGVVEVRAWNAASTVELDLYGVGLSRDSSTAAWVGTNIGLSGRRGEGIMVAVDTASSWVPRRLCGLCESANPDLPRAASPLLMARGGADVNAWWPADARAVAGYTVHRVATKQEIPGVLASPVHLTESSPTPAFPVSDRGAVDVAESWFYQVVGRGCGGEPGAL